MSSVRCWWFPVSYDPLPYTDDAEESIWCAVTVTFTDGETKTITGDYLDAEPLPELGCGIEEAASELGLIHLLSDEALYLKVCREVDRQLALRPLAMLACPEFSIRIDLVVPPGDNDAWLEED